MAIDDSLDSEEDRATVSMNGVFLHFLKRHPVYFAVLLVGVFAVVEFSTGSYIELKDLKHPFPRYRQKRAEKLAAVYADQLLAEVGHGVEVSCILAFPNMAGENPVAEYEPFTRGIFFFFEELLDTDSSHDSDLFASLGHVVAHAVFFQSDLLPLAVPSQQIPLVGEMAAEVLGAHICGRALNHQGMDETRAAVEFLDVYRRSCLESQRRFLSHHGPVDVIGDMNRICFESPSIWTAAHRIAEEYFAVDESGAWKYRDGLFTTGQSTPVGDIPRFPESKEEFAVACLSGSLTFIAEKYFVVDESGEWKYRDGLNLAIPSPQS